jgi:hypothetical protein
MPGDGVRSTLEAQGEQVLGIALDLARQAWQGRLIAAYALGSLAHGGFSAASDVDLALVLSDPLLPADSAGITRLAETIKGTNLPFADRLSVFWGSPTSLAGDSPGGRFPPLDRLDLIKYGRLLTGVDVRSRLGPPSRKELVIAGAEFALARLDTDEVVAKLKDPQDLARSDRKSLTKLILFPVRFLFTARTGEVGRNEAAVEHFVGIRRDAASTLARMALEWRNTQPQADAVRAIAAGVLPLYEEFLLEHERRLRDYGRGELADAFARWRLKLRG